MEERFTVAGVLRTHAAERPDDVMFVDGDQHRTWRAQHRRAGQVAHALAADGVGVGDRVALLDRNGLAYFDTLFGGALIGAVNVAVNWRLAPSEMAAIIDDARAAVLVVHADYVANLAGMESGLPSVRRVVVVGADSLEPAAALPGPDRAVGYEEWLDDRPTDDPGHVGAPRDVSVQLYTSGTTGLPKGVMLSNENLSTAMGEAASVFSIGPDTVSLVAMPLFHIGGAGWALSGMSRGGRSVILRDVDPSQLLRLVADERVTHAFLVPAVLMFLLATPGVEEADLSSLRYMFYGASPISEDVLVRCLKVFKCQFVQVYGMTETTGAISALAAEDHDPDGSRSYLLRSAGRPHRGVEVRIVDPDTDEEVPPGEVGEIWTRSPYNMVGYWERPEDTADALRDGGWLRTGDAGYVDEDGYIFLRDRIKDMIVTGGENVYPAEVENVLLSDPRVADAAVIGVPDDKWGEAVKAIVVRAGPRAEDGTSPVTVEELERLSRSRLAGFKVPKSFEFVDVLPRNPTGKVLKRQLRAPYWEGRTRHIH